MSLRFLLFVIGVLALLISLELRVKAQSNDRIGETWKGPNSSVIMNVLKNRRSESAAGTAKPRVSVVTFKPVGDSGVARSLADALGRNAEEKAALIEAFGQIKLAYEAEVKNLVSRTENKVVGVWSKSASSPTGLAGTIAGTQKLMTNAGYYKGQYQFNSDGN